MQSSKTGGLTFLAASIEMCRIDPSVLLSHPPSGFRPGAAVIKYVPMVAPKQGRIAAKQVPRPAEQPVEESQIQGAVQDDQGR